MRINGLYSPYAFRSPKTPFSEVESKTITWLWVRNPYGILNWLSKLVGYLLYINTTKRHDCIKPYQEAKKKMWSIVSRGATFIKIGASLLWMFRKLSEVKTTCIMWDIRFSRQRVWSLESNWLHGSTSQKAVNFFHHVWSSLLIPSETAKKIDIKKIH
jgi:hypothetical protein